MALVISVEEMLDLRVYTSSAVTDTTRQFSKMIVPIAMLYYNNIMLYYNSHIFKQYTSSLKWNRQIYKAIMWEDRKLYKKFKRIYVAWVKGGPRLLNLYHLFLFWTMP